MEQPTSRDVDVAVVGLGGIGSAAAYWVARRAGIRLAGFEQFELGHANGASHDHSRIIRLSYHRPDYVRLARRAYATWADVEAEADEPIVTRIGGLDLFPPGAAIAEADYTASMGAEDVAFERLDGREVMRRWPQWRLDDGTVALFQAETGIADPSRGNGVHQRLAVAHGARLHPGTAVDRLSDTGSGVVLKLRNGGSLVAGRVIVTADAWTNDLLAPLDLRLPLTVTQEQVTYFDVADPSAFAPDRFPVWIWMDDPSFYGFPTYGLPGPKAGQDVGGPEVTPATRTFEPHPPATARLRTFVERHLPGLAVPPLLTKTCLYTLTPDRDFVVDRLPDHPDIVVVLGAAHGYKFASVLGRIAAELACDGSTPSAGELEAFRIDRPVLRQPDPPGRFLV
ncbi:MAG TPA: N-methyl-L-tryptophan oxidase [Candidatus Limnocylindrales bacterium]|jgi:sarcosine oxidase